ncbi:hypothetical protein [Lactobacillus amylovorus]|uniref:hypothetical protein n=1 Tax=Lactobacillus amylovorus TaxID=1604 RepID=UPI003F90D4E8
MAVFENESNASQDANYREHLNHNWDNGNIAFDNLFGKYNNLLGKYNDIIGRLDHDENEIHDLQGDVKDLTKKYNDDIEATNQRLAELEKAVFEAQYINDTDDVADYDKSVVSQDINDTNVVDDDNGLIIEEDKHKSLPSEVND